MTLYIYKEYYNGLLPNKPDSFLLLHFMNKAYLLLGSNLGDRKKYLSDAVTLLEIHAGKITLKSMLYNTAPWGVTDQDDFLNQAVCVETKLSAQQLLENILYIEEKLGRIRIQKWEARTIDIDILFFNSDIISTDNLTVPHPFLHQRRFALLPLSEIEGNFIHPVLKKSVKILLADCDQNLVVDLV